MAGKDMIHNYLTQEQLKDVQEQLFRVVQWYERARYPVTGNVMGRKELTACVNAIFYAYLDKDSAKTQFWADAYRDALHNWLLEDHSWAQSPSYAYARMGGTRIGKTGAMFVLTNLGFHDYYNDPKILDCYDWMASFSKSPNGDYTKFGDAVGTNSNSHAISKALNLYLPIFQSPAGEDIAKNFMWFYDWQNYPATAQLPNSFDVSNALMYLLRPTTLLEGEMPKSMLKENSGAALWDNTIDSEEAVQGVLYSLSQPDSATVDRTGHDQENANSLSLSAYGQQMIVNAGTEYNPYPGTTPDGTPYSHAQWHNVVLLDNQTQHLNMDGDGLTDGLKGGCMEFGTTLSGDAIDGATHERSLVLTKADTDNNLNAYFVVFDEVNITGSASKARIIFQPNTKLTSIDTIQVNESYEAPIDGHVNNPNSNGTEKMKIHFATQPDNVVNRVSYKSYVGEPTSALEAEFVPANNVARLATVFFPEDDMHTAAPMIKLPETAQYSGLQITHNTYITDYVVQPKIGSTIWQGNMCFIGSGLVYREKNEITTNYLAIDSKRFLSHGNSYGFLADDYVSLEMKGTIGSINSLGTKVRFSHKNITGVKIDGVIAPIIAEYSGWKDVIVPAGQHTVEIMTPNGSCTDRIYCTPVLDASREWIAHVNFKDLDNPSGSDGGYIASNSTGTHITQGYPYELSLTPGFLSGNSEVYFRAWIDYNQDGDFEDAGELIFDPSASAGTVSNNIAIPVDVKVGSTRMRVAMNYESAPEPCGDNNAQFGEVEDYCITIDAFDPDCPYARMIDNSLITDSTYRADDHIISVGVVPGSGDVLFTAGTQVCLEAGFEVLCLYRKPTS